MKQDMKRKAIHLEETCRTPSLQQPKNSVDAIQSHLHKKEESDNYSKSQRDR